MIRYAVAVAVTLALLGAAWGLGWHQGRAALQGALDAAAVRSDAADKADARELAIAEQAQRAIAAQTEDVINAASDLGAVCLPRGWLRANAPNF